MNFLAHAYLSFQHPEILVGNMISDFVKGRKRLDYSQGIQQGILLHRQIDAFTEMHPATKEARKFLRPAVGLYSGAFVDVAYDHFLANDQNDFPILHEHCSETYRVLFSVTFYRLFFKPCYHICSRKTGCTITKLYQEPKAVLVG